MATLIFNAGFVNNASPQVVLTSTELTGAAAPTINISSTLIADGTTIASVVSGGAMVYDQYTATWSYRLAGADLATYVYKAKVTTTYATASPASVQVLGIVIPDELVSTRLAPTTAGRTLDVAATGEAGVDLTNKLDTAGILPTVAAGGASGLALVGSLMGLADDALTAAKFDESTAFPLKLADTGATKVARIGADSDTLETLSDQIDVVQAKTDTIGTGATLTIVSPLAASVLTITIGASLAATVAGLTLASGWTLFDFTLKRDADQADADALLRIRVSNPAVGASDGALVVSGAPATVAQRTLGSLTVAQGAGTVAIALTPVLTAALSAYASLVWDLKEWTLTAQTIRASGSAVVQYTPTGAVV
jgi:hypothetical protein